MTKEVNEMKRISVKLGLIIFVTATLFSTSGAWGTELSIPAVKAKSGQSVDVPVMIDLVDNLAGVKLVMKYDTEILTFKKADKTKQTSSLMHIVNNKKPGTLVIVMAGARGIKGKKFSILSLRFEVKKGLESLTTKMKIHEIQMMSDKLKDIKCKVRIEPMTIAADSSGAKKSGQDAKEAKSGKKSGQDAQTPEKSGEDAKKDGLDTKSGKDAKKSGQDAKEAKPGEKFGQDAQAPEKFGEDAKKSGSDAKDAKSGKDVKKSGQDAKEAGQAPEKSGEDAKKSGSDAKDAEQGGENPASDQNLRKADQEAEKN